MASDAYSALIPFANELADLARARARRYFRSELEVSIKADASPVTQADQEIEREIRQAIAARHPDHACYGEEDGGTVGNGLTWVVDPIDGTRSFICGVPLFGSLIALLDAGVPVLGVLEMPMLGERWVGHAGGTTLNGKPVRVSGCATLGEARLFATSPEMFTGTDAEAFAAVSRQVRVRRFGTDCYAYGLLATGCCDLVIEASLQPYDVMALVPVIEHAGGIVTNWHGAPIGPGFDGRIVAAASRALHAQALAVLNGIGNGNDNGSGNSNSNSNG